MGLINIIPKKQYKWQKYVTDNLRLYNVIVAPRQHGKTELFSELVKSVVYNDKIKNPWVNLCSDTKVRVKLLYGNRFYQMFGFHPDYKWPEQQKTQIQVKRPQGDHFFINVFGATHQPKAPEGTTSHFNLVDEAWSVPSRYIKETLMPTADATGGPTILTGTVDPGDFFTLFHEAQQKMKDPNSPWFAFYFKLGDEYSKECRTPEQIQNIKDRYDMTKPEDVTQFQKMYMCDWFAGMSGTPFKMGYYEAERNGRIGDFPFDPNFKVGTAWDNGLGYKAIWFWQIVHFQPRLIDFMIWKDESLRKACRDIKAWYKRHEAEQYIHILPHTMRAREESDGISLRDKLKEYLGDSAEYVTNKRVSNIDAKIETTCNVMNSCLFNREKCQYGLLSLLKYRRVENQKNRTRSKSFVKDEHSHGAEAFTEFCVAWNNEELYYADDSRKGYGQDDDLRRLYGVKKSPFSPY